MKDAMQFVWLTSLLFLTSPLSWAQEAEDREKDRIDPEAAKYIGRLGEDHRTSADKIQFSAAERLLWLANQLKNIHKPGKLKYRFKREGSMGDAFSDTVELDIVDVKPDGKKSAQVTFLTGERNLFVPGNENATANPVLAVYLQGDVAEMNRLTKGNWRYFQRWIKRAIAEDAKIEPVTIDFDQRKIDGKKISFTPYLKDPQRQRYEKYAAKRYEITVSDDIPGMIYRIHTVIPDTETKTSAPLVEETLTFVGVEFKG